MKRLACILTSILAIMACGDDAAPIGDTIDAPTDAAPTIDAALDAFASLGRGETCTPLLDQCQAGLTCRILGHADGVCLPIGTLVESDICETSSACGAHMACLPAELGRWRCVVVCSVPGNVGPARCRDGALCQRYWSDDEGFCQ